MPYLGDEDAIELRTTQMQEREDDEDISTNNTSTPPSPPLGPITLTRAHQLNHQVNSFSNSCPLYLENGSTRTLVLLRNDGEDMEERGFAWARFGQ